MNAILGNFGASVTFIEPIEAQGSASLGDLVADENNGKQGGYAADRRRQSGLRCAGGNRLRRCALPARSRSSGPPSSPRAAGKLQTMKPRFAASGSSPNRTISNPGAMSAPTMARVDRSASHFAAVRQPIGDRVSGRSRSAISAAVAISEIVREHLSGNPSRRALSIRRGKTGYSRGAWSGIRRPNLSTYPSPALPPSNLRRDGRCGKSCSRPIPQIWDGSFNNNSWLQGSSQAAEQIGMGQRRAAQPGHRPIAWRGGDGRDSPDAARRPWSMRRYCCNRTLNRTIPSCCTWATAAGAGGNVGSPDGVGIGVNAYHILPAANPGFAADLERPRPTGKPAIWW